VSTTVVPGGAPATAYDCRYTAKQVAIKTKYELPPDNRM
jgi:hypothetical protein